VLAFGFSFNFLLVGLLADLLAGWLTPDTYKYGGGVVVAMVSIFMFGVVGVFVVVEWRCAMGGWLW
jgi:hypothetical protein